jgi:tripartite ATP-independent transporter DctP family solute receptor
MTPRISIRMSGYGPPSTSFSRGLKLIGDRLTTRFGGEVDIKYVWNIMDFGYKAEEIVWLVEHGVLTLGYQSSSYLTDRVPELGIVDLPFFFQSKEQARAAMDGALGARLSQAIEDRIPYRVLGWFENGMRHISNRLRPLHTPSDLAGMKIRVLPSEIQAKTFALLGAEPVKCDLTEAIAWIKQGKLDAQENPLANTVTYGVHKFHRFHTLTYHFYISRPIFVHRASFEAWPAHMQQAIREAVHEAVAFQRGETVKEHEDSLAAIKAEGCQIAELSREGHDAFLKTVQPLYVEARRAYEEELFRLATKA